MRGADLIGVMRGGYRDAHFRPELSLLALGAVGAYAA